MANRIAGITIEIGGDTSKLTSALSAVDKNLKNTQSNLRDVNKLLKLDPSNVDLLKQKQGYLTEAIKDTSERLTTLKTALQQMKDANTTGEVTEQQKALEREIANTEQKLDGLKKEYKDFGSVATQQLKEVGEKVKDVGGKMQEVGKGLTTHVTAPIAAVGAGAVASWKEVDEAMDTITKKTGKTGKELEDLQKSAKNIATTIPTSFQTAAEAVGEVNTRFGLTGDALDDLATQFVEFAELNDTDVSDSIDSVQKAMEAMNVPVEDAGKFLDTLNATAQNTGIDVKTLTGSIVKNAAAFEDMGLSAGDTVELLGDLETSGVDVNQAMAGLKKAFQNAAKEGKPTDQVLRKVQKAIKGAGTDTEATNYAMEIFGKSAGPNIAKAVRDGKISFESMGKSLDEYAGSVETTFNNTKDPLDDVTIAMNQMKDIGSDIVEASAPMISEVMGQLRDIIEDLSEKWNSLNDDQKQMIIKVALVIAAVGPLVTILGGVVTAVGSIISGVGGLIGLITGGSGAVAAAGAATTAVEGVTAAVGTTAAGGGLIATLGGLVTAAAPFLIGGAVVVGVIAAVALIVKNWDKIKEGAKKLVENVKTKWNDFKKKTAETFQNIADTAKNKFEAAKTAATMAANNLKTSVTTKFTEAKTAVSTAASDIAAKVKEKFDDAKSKAATAIDNLKTDVSKKFSDTKTAVSTAASDIASKVKEKFDTAKTAASDAVKSLAKKVSDKFDDAKTDAKTAVEKIYNNVKDYLGDAASEADDESGDIKKSISDNVGDAASDAVAGFKDIASNAKSKLHDAAVAASDRGYDVARYLQDSIGNKINDVKDDFATLADTTKSKLYLAAVHASNQGAEFMRALKRYAGSSLSDFIDNIGDIPGKVKSALDGAKDKLSDFTWKFPQPSMPRMPHIKLKYNEFTFGGKTYKYPTGFTTEWYAKAYTNPVMFTRPTVLQTPQGSKGFGDRAGGEIVLSDRKLREIAGSGETNYNINIYGAAGQDVNALADAVQNRLVALQRQREAAGLA